MAAVIIRKKDVKRLGKELLNEMFKFLHDEYILTEYEDMKEVQKEFLKKIMLNNVNDLHKNFDITDKTREKLNEYVNNKSSIEDFKIKFLKDCVNDTEVIYNILNSLKFDMEINEDLYYKTKAFLDIFRVFESGYIYL